MVSGQETSASPIRGFIGLDTLRRKAVLLYDSVEHDQQQRIFPSMSFSCNGIISKWTFVARSQTGEDLRQYPLLQLWKRAGPRRYRKVYESSITSTMSGQSQFTVGEHIPDKPVRFEAGYMFGVYQPHDGNSRLIVRYANVSSNVPKGQAGYGYLNHYRDPNTSLKVFDISGAKKGNDYPLVAVNTGETQQVLIFVVLQMYSYLALLVTLLLL